MKHDRQLRLILVFTLLLGVSLRSDAGDELYRYRVIGKVSTSDLANMATTTAIPSVVHSIEVLLDTQVKQHPSIANTAEVIDLTHLLTGLDDMAADINRDLPPSDDDMKDLETVGRGTWAAVDRIAVTESQPRPSATPRHVSETDWDTARRAGTRIAIGTVIGRGMPNPLGVFGALTFSSTPTSKKADYPAAPSTPGASSGAHERPDHEVFRGDADKGRIERMGTLAFIYVSEPSSDVQIAAQIAKAKAVIARRSGIPRSGALVASIADGATEPEFLSGAAFGVIAALVAFMATRALVRRRTWPV